MRGKREAYERMILLPHKTDDPEALERDHTQILRYPYVFCVFSSKSVKRSALLRRHNTEYTLEPKKKPKSVHRSPSLRRRKAKRQLIAEDKPSVFECYDIIGAVATIEMLHRAIDTYVIKNFPEEVFSELELGIGCFDESFVCNMLKFTYLTDPVPLQIYLAIKMLQKQL